MQRYRKALVTGAGRGIGAAIARALAAQGVELVALNRSPAPLAELVADLESQTRIAPYSVDVTEFEALDALLDTILAEHPDIDLVILNAGVDLPQPIEAFDWRIARQQIDTNLTANYVFAAKLIPHLLKQGEGRFAVISSLAAFAGCPLEHAYNASKAGARMMIDGLRAELLDTPIEITGIYPGFVATDMIAGNAFESSNNVSAEEAADIIVSGLQKGRDEILFPEDTAQLVNQVVGLGPRERANIVRGLMNPGNTG